MAAQDLGRKYSVKQTPLECFVRIAAILLGVGGLEEVLVARAHCIVAAVALTEQEALWQRHLLRLPGSRRVLTSIPSLVICPFLRMISQILLYSHPSISPIVPDMDGISVRRH